MPFWLEKEIMKKLLVTFISLLLLAVSTAKPALSADIPEEQFVTSSLSTQGLSDERFGVFFEESVDTLRMPSLLYGYNVINNKFNAVDFCSSVDDVPCAGSDRLKYYALFPPCIKDVDIDCIESVYAIPDGSPAKIQGNFLKYMPEKVARPYKADAKYGIPQGGNAGLWQIPGVKHKGGGEDYAVIVSLVGDIDKKNSSGPDLGELRVVILPQTIVRNVGYKANIANMRENENTGTKNVAIDHPGSQNFEPCAIVEDGACALRQGFPDDVQFGISVRFSKVLPGWLHGRISSPQINYQVKSYGTFIEMQGYATKVPVLGGWVVKDASNSEQLDAIKRDYWLPNQGSMGFPGASGDNSVNSLSAWAKLFKDSAVAYPSQWIFYNLPEYQMQSSNQCIRNSATLAGFVTTNSTTYAAGPPVFNSDTQSLDYKVASPHYLKDGSVFKGEYNLYIDSKVARCIYKFSSAPISASVSIVNESGEAKVATTVMTERGGWLHLSAAGFTFSSPTLRVKLSQAAEEQQIPDSIQATPKKTTITCIKGKKTRKVSSIKPACPSGWKKK
jgi:hypothetical protein